MAISDVEFQALVFAGCLLGALGRTLLPYLQKLKENEEAGQEPPNFQKKYMFTFAYSLAISIGVAMTLFSSVLTNVDKTATIPSIMIISGLAGWGANSIVNNIQRVATTRTASDSPPPPTSTTTSAA